MNVASGEPGTSGSVKGMFVERAPRRNVLLQPYLEGVEVYLELPVASITKPLSLLFFLT